MSHWIEGVAVGRLSGMPRSSPAKKALVTLVTELVVMCQYERDVVASARRSGPTLIPAAPPIHRDPPKPSCLLLHCALR